MRPHAYLILVGALAALPQTVWAQRGEKWVVSWTGSAQGPYPIGNPSAQPDQKFAFPTPEAGARNQTFRLIVRPDLWAGRPAAANQCIRHKASDVRRRCRPAGWRGGHCQASNRPVTFGSMSSITVAPGASVWSDAVTLAFVRNPAAPELAGRKLSVSFHIAGESGPMTWHAKALQTSYISTPGSGSLGEAEDEAAFPYSTASWFFLDAVEMMAPAASFAIAAFGDSITDGTASNHERRRPLAGCAVASAARDPR